MGDRVAVLESGSLQQCASPQTLYDDPANLIVAAFIGSPSMNLFEAQLSADARSLKVGSNVLPAQAALQRAPGLREYSGRMFVIGLRPEDLPLAADDSVPGIAGMIDLIEALGSEQLVHFSSDAKRARPAVIADLDSEDNLPEAEVSDKDGWVARLGARTAVRAGEQVRFAPDLSRLHCFDPVSGDAIH